MAYRRMTDALTSDDFLGGRLTLLQPKTGYRAGVDPVLLAASVPAVIGQSILDLGCGVGAAMLCLGARVPGIHLCGLELQNSYAELARRNAALNGIAAEVIEGDVSNIPDTLLQRRFDHVILNPPYFNRDGGSEASDEGRECAMGERTPLETWISSASKRCAPGGYVTIIHRPARLPDLLSGMKGKLGSIEVLPLIPREGRSARLVIVRARKGGRAEFRLHHGMVLHQGHVHERDEESYTSSIACVLRNGAALRFPP